MPMHDESFVAHPFQTVDTSLTFCANKKEEASVGDKGTETRRQRHCVRERARGRVVMIQKFDAQKTQTPGPPNPEHLKPKRLDPPNPYLLSTKPYCGSAVAVCTHRNLSKKAIALQVRST